MSKYVMQAFPQEHYRFALYDNKNKLTWQEIKSAHSGCVAIMNTAYFGLTTYDVQSHTMVSGQWLMEPKYHEYGLCINQDGRLTVDYEDKAVWNYTVGLPPLYINGTKYYAYQEEARNGISFAGVGPDGTVHLLLSSKDEGLTSREACDLLLAKGCVHILRFDGSWSSQGTLGPGMDVDPSQERKARIYLLVFAKDSGNTEEISLIQYPISKNPTMTNPTSVNKNKAMLHSTATPGANAKAFADSMNSSSAVTSVEFVIDESGIYQLMPMGRKSWHAGVAYSGGPSANNTHWACELCEPIECRFIPIEWASRPLYSGGPNNTPYVVKRLQQELKQLGFYTMDIDGSYGPGTVAAVKAFQVSAGISQDGSVGPATLAKLQARKGSHLNYNPTLAQAFFDKIYQQAVQLFAWGMIQTGSDPIRDIICHSEGYALGIASNHADVMHWFPEHGKSMDNFRSDVRDYMEGSDDMNQETFNEMFNIATAEYNSKIAGEPVSPWAQAAWDKAVAKGLFDGTQPKVAFTREQAAIIFDRLGLLAPGNG